QSRELVDIKPEIQLLAQSDRHRFSADVVDHRFINRKPWIWVDDLVSIFRERENGEKNDRFAAGNYNHFVGRNVDSPGLTDILSDSLSQLRQACRRAVVSKSLVQRVGSRVDDVSRGIEIRLADF